MAATLIVPAVADARQATVSGVAVAGPGAGGVASLPVVLSQGSQRKLHAASPVVRLLMAGSSKLQGPKGVSVLASKLRAGDEIQGRATVPKRSRKKPSTSPPSLRLSGAKLLSRESQFSNDELTAAIYALGSQISGVQSAIGTLQSLLTTLQTRLAELQTLVGSGNLSGDALKQVQDQINALLGQIGTLTGAVNALQGLQGQINGLVAQVATLPTSANLAALQTQITTLTGRLNLLTGVTGLCAPTSLVRPLLLTTGICT